MFRSCFSSLITLQTCLTKSSPYFKELTSLQGEREREERNELIRTGINCTLCKKKKKTCFLHIFKITLITNLSLHVYNIPFTAFSINSSQASKSPFNTNLSCRSVNMGCSNAILVFFCSDSKASV